MNTTIKAAVAVLAISLLAACSDSTMETTSTGGNAAIENIMTRTSVRQYAPERTIGADTVETLLRAAMSAPSAVNKQPWEFVVLDNREAIDSLAEVLPYAKMLTGAPLAVVTCGNMERALEGEGRGFWIQDVSAATENLLLAAHAMGLGAVWTGVYPDSTRTADVSRALGLPSNVIPLAVVPIGYPAGEQTPKDKWDAGKVHKNGWK